MVDADDGNEWLRERLDGNPRFLPDDCVEYTIYIIDSKLNHLQIGEKLRQVQKAGHKLAHELTKGFIWQRESFSLAFERASTSVFLRGRTNYGDSVEDEWLIVYILRELSQIFDDIWIRLVDTDGEFLLIEAAGALPRWLNPQVADHRVWLNSGKLLIIGPKSSKTKTDKRELEIKSLTLEDAHAIIRNEPSSLIASPSIQNEAFYRLQRYPGQILKNLHHTFLRIPRKLAYILHQNPANISPAVEAFYLRDPISLRPLQASAGDKLTFPPTDLVRVSATFTKIGYAQLKNQQFDTPTAWGRCLTIENEATSQREMAIGMKLISGFEMLMSDPHQQDKKQVREIKLLLEDLDSGDDSLPSDAEIKTWDMREDDEKWLSIDFNEFQKELSGKAAKGNTAGKGAALGDAGVYGNLQKIVERFENFAENDADGAEDAEYLDDMDEDDGDMSDDDGSLSDDDADTGLDHDVSFNEDEFNRMIRDMMGIPKDTDNDRVGSLSKATFSGSKPRIPREGNGEGKDLQESMRAIEKELREAGALQLNPEPPDHKSIASPKAIDTASNHAGQPIRADATQEIEEVKDGDVEIDYELANSLLEGFKSRDGKE
ncbi:hypothetical protein ACLMJK_000094 [Lecanora helva]